MKAGKSNLVMDVKVILICVALLILGVIIMVTHKFYRYETSDMLFATKFRVFLGGLLLSLVGVYGLFKAISESIK
jgi:hypothetical protein